MKIINNIFFAFFCLSVLGFSACKNTIRGKEAATYGTNKIVVDETLQEPISSELQLFQIAYKDAHFTPTYLPETEMVQQLLRDSFQIAVMARKFTDEEMTYFKSRKLTPNYTHIGYDAVALVVNKNNPDTLLDYSKILDIMRGKITTWKQLSPKSRLDKINLVFDNSNSSTVTYLKSKSGVTETPQIASALERNTEVVKYVGNNLNSLAIMGSGWLTDMNTKQLEELNKNAKIVYLTSDNPEFKNYYQPKTEQIRDRKYPFMREIFAVDCQGFSGLGVGIAAYITSNEGQLALLKTGLLPRFTEPRNINIK
jgi:phosphate transport system substrate-binding protein